MNEMLSMRIACLNKPLLVLASEVRHTRKIVYSSRGATFQSSDNEWYNFYDELQKINEILLRSFND